MFDLTEAVLSENDVRDMIVGVSDNEGETCDRYSVYFYDGSVLCMSGSPAHPQGVSIWSQGRLSGDDENEIGFEELPPRVQEHVYSRVREGYRDFIERSHGEGMLCSSIRREIMHDTDGFYA